MTIGGYGKDDKTGHGDDRKGRTDGKRGFRDIPQRANNCAVRERRDRKGGIAMETKGTQAADHAVTVAGRAFCFTGRGRLSRAEMGRMVTAHGGTVHQRVTRKTDYLVVGSRGSKRWQQPFIGSKTAAAMRLIVSGGGIRIVGEDALRRALG